MVDDPHRTWLIGEHNPYRPEARFALYPLPPNATGGRLARVLGLDADAYLAAFERRNLMPHDYDVTCWKVRDARRRAEALLREVPAGDALVLCGARVAAAFRLPATPLLRHRVALVGQGPLVRPREVLVIPHPSGRSYAWNDKTMAPRVRAAVAELLEGARR